MAKKKSSLLLPIAGTAILGAIAVKAYGLANTASNIRMEFAGVAFKGISGGRLRLGLSFRFLNPTPTDVPLEFILANVKLDGNLIGEITESTFRALRQSNPRAFTLMGKNATTLPITVSMPLSSAVLNLLEMLVSSQTRRKISVEGFWKAEGLPKSEFNITEEIAFA